MVSPQHPKRATFNATRAAELLLDDDFQTNIVVEEGSDEYADVDHYFDEEESENVECDDVLIDAVPPRGRQDNDHAGKTMRLRKMTMMLPPKKTAI